MLKYIIYIHLILRTDNETGTKSIWLTCSQITKLTSDKAGASSPRLGSTSSPPYHTGSGKGMVGDWGSMKSTHFQQQFQGDNRPTLGQNIVTSLLAQVPTTNLLSPQPPTDSPKCSSYKCFPQKEIRQLPYTHSAEVHLGTRPCSRY